MKGRGKHNVLGVLVDAVGHAEAVQRVMAAAVRRQPMAVSALAVHGVMSGVSDRAHRYRLNALDLVVADGQPVRWALNLLHKTRLRQRVYGPTLMLDLCQQASDRQLPVFLYGGTPGLLELLQERLLERFPQLKIAGARPSRFRRLTPEEGDELRAEIRASGARITFVGLGCPRQEVWAYENRRSLSMPLVAVGAAFAFYAGILPQAPRWMQQWGLEWLFRLVSEPRRLWKRYLLLNPCYLVLLSLQWARLRTIDSQNTRRPRQEILYG